MKRKFPPMPREMIVFHPIVLKMNNAAFGILNTLVDHFWFTNCAPLPESDYQLFLIAKAHKPTWRLNRDDIKAVLQDVTPELTLALKRYRDRKSILDSLRDRGIATKRRKKSEKLIAQAEAIPEPNEPRREERFRAAKIVKPAKVDSRSGFTDAA